MVQKLRVLFRVKHFQQCGSRISLVGRANLVDFIKHDDRVLHPDFLERLNNFPWHGADIGSSVSLYLRFISHTSEAEAIELAAQSLGYRLPD